MAKTIQTKREREKAMVSDMIALYCRKQHGAKSGLCVDCAALNTYARERSDKCPFMETKTFCSNCRVHCYKPEMREKIRVVMRFSGPRMIFHHPVTAVRHVLETKKEKDDWRIVMKLKKILLVIIGCISVGLGALGVVLPILPTVPFLLLAAFCFARSSERLNNWFIGTKLYKNNLESYVKGEGMTRKTKIKIMVTVTVLMTIGFIMMDQILVGRIVLACVWVFHVIYFVFGVKTIKKGQESIQI